MNRRGAVCDSVCSCGCVALSAMCVAVCVAVCCSVHNIRLVYPREPSYDENAAQSVASFLWKNPTKRGLFCKEDLAL